MSQVDLLEYTLAGDFAIDTAAGIIRGAKLLGRHSANRGGTREYTDGALKKAATLMEGVPVFIDHLPEIRDAAKVRNQRDHWGEVRNVRMKPDGVYGDIHYLKSHAQTAEILERAERFPNHVGCSQNARGGSVLRNGKELIEDIEIVRSVDIVTRPATTKNLREFHEDTYMATITEAVSGLSPERQAIPSVKAIRDVIAKKPEIGLASVELTEADSSVAVRSIVSAAVAHLLENMSDADAAKHLAAFAGVTSQPTVDVGSQHGSPLDAALQRLNLSEALDHFGLRKADIAPERLELLKKESSAEAMIQLIESWPAIHRSPGKQYQAGVGNPGSRLRSLVEGSDEAPLNGSYDELRKRSLRSLQATK